MDFHPRNRAPWNRPMSRRRMLQVTGGASMAAWLAACGGGGGSDGSASAADIAIGTPQNPVKQPVYDDNPPIESNLQPEKGPLRLYNWDAYIWTPVLKDFAAKYDVDFELTTFYNLEEATRKLRTGKLQFDVFFPTAEIIPKYVAGKLLQPLNHDYLPNLRSNVWPRLADPYYDTGSRYTVPYVVYETGIGWRVDMVSEDIAALDNPWEAFWDPTYRNIAGLYDDYRETIGVGMYKNGITDINSARPRDLETAKNSLIDLIDLVNIRYTIDGAYSRLPEGKFGIHHAWSGDIIGARNYFPEGQDPSVLRFVWPPKTSQGGGYVSNDSLAIPRGAEHPVLAHLFLDYMLDDKASLKNFSWLGYQPPQKSIEPGALVQAGYVEPSVETAVMTEHDFTLGQVPVQLTPEEDALWLQAWSQVKSGG